MEKEPTPKFLLALIRAHCLDCSGGSRMEVRRCKVEYCKLWPYRNAETKDKKTGRRGKYQQITMYEFMNQKEGKTDNASGM